MSPNPCFAIVLEGGLVQDVIVQDWPRQIPPPRVVIVDYDTEGADDTGITRFPMLGETAEALCHIETPVIYESVPKALSPNIVFAVLDGADDPTD